MTYTELMNTIKQIEADTAAFYGDFGFAADVIWDGNSVADFSISWPSIAKSGLRDSYCFAEGLSGFCFALSPLLEVTVDED